MRRFALISAVALSATLLAAMLLGPTIGGHAAPATAAPRATAVPGTSGCRGQVTGTLSAGTVRVCDTVTVTTRTEPACPACPGGVHVVFVQNEETPNWQSTWQRDVMVDAVDALFQSGYEDILAGVVVYDVDGAQRAVELTDRAVEVQGALKVRRATNFVYHWEDAARHGVEMLTAARPRRAADPQPCELVVFMAHSGCTNCTGQWDDQVSAARMFHRAGVTLIAACEGTSPPEGILCIGTRQMPTNRRYYVESPDTGLGKTLVSALDEVAAGSAAKLQRLALEHHLPSGLAYVAGSASEPPDVVPAAGGTLLRWQWEPATTLDPRTITYRSAPVAEGRHVITGTMTLEDKSRAVRLVTMRPITVTVAGLCLPDTPTATHTSTPTEPPTATPPPTVTMNPTTTATATAQPDPTRVALPAFFPLLLREDCVPGTQRTDVVLVLDASSSMGEPTAAGRSKLAAAQDATRSFLGQLRLDAGDQAAIVAFNGGASLLAPLTADRGALDKALAGITLAQYTRIDLGLAAAHAELNSARRRPDNQPVLILLTDGRANPVPVSEAERAAADAKDDGVVLFTIGLGADLDLDALRRMASRPDYFYQAPDGEALAGIYRGIAVSIPCPVSAFWGRR